MMKLLQQASEALCVYDADSLERLAAQAGTVPVLPQDLCEAMRLMEVLRLQSVAARAHLKLCRKLQDVGYEVDQLWAH